LTKRTLDRLAREGVVFTQGYSSYNALVESEKVVF